MSDRLRFQQLAEERLRDADTLLNAGQLTGTYYFAGVAVECALKACIARTQPLEAFPGSLPRGDVFIHDIPRLAATAGVVSAADAYAQTNPAFKQNWSIVNSWIIESRYDLTLPSSAAPQLYSAVADPVDGVLAWLKTKW